MNGLHKSVIGKVLLLSPVAAILALNGVVSESRAQIITMTDHNSVAQVNVSSQAGMFNWSVESQNQLAQQWFWYRVGNSGPQSSIDTISAPSVTQSTARTLSALYANATFSVRIDYALSGGALGSGVSGMNETITINNLTGSALDYHFFQYSDFDLGGTQGGDTVQLGRNNQNLFNEAFQSKGGASLTETVDAANTPGANHGEAALFNATLLKLNSGSPVTLSDTAGPITGDATWALEWDVSIAPGQSFIISKTKNLTVPEPSSFALLALGAVGCLVKRIRRSR
jgi:hypothetical protein